MKASLELSLRSLVPVLAALLPALAGCTSLQSVSVTQIPTDRSRPIHAEVSNSALFGVHFDNDFADGLAPELLAQCPRGRITGLLTKQESSLYVIVSTRRIIASGYCVYDAPAQAAAPAPPPPAAPAPASASTDPSNLRAER